MRLNDDAEGATVQGALAEGAALSGQSLALLKGTLFTVGWAADTNLGANTPLRIADVPPIQIELTTRTEPHIGLGGPVTTKVVPVIANADVAATGVRLRLFRRRRRTSNRPIKGLKQA